MTGSSVELAATIRIGRDLLPNKAKPQAWASFILDALN
jgi:hypothetical protein